MSLNGGSRANGLMAGFLIQNGGSRSNSAIVFRKVILNGGSTVKELHCLSSTKVSTLPYPLCFFKLEDTAGIIIALVSALMTPILSGDLFYADMRFFNENV